MLPQYYRGSPFWSVLRRELDPLLELFSVTDNTADITEASTRLLLDLLGWQGRIIDSSLLLTRPGRSQRLADLTEITRARGYLCGTGGMAYLTTDHFDAIGVDVTHPDSGIWAFSRVNSALTPFMQIGFNQASSELLTVSARHRDIPRCLVTLSIAHPCSVACRASRAH